MRAPVCRATGAGALQIATGAAAALLMCAAWIFSPCARRAAENWHLEPRVGSAAAVRSAAATPSEVSLSVAWGRCRRQLGGQVLGAHADPGGELLYRCPSQTPGGSGRR